VADEWYFVVGVLTARGPNEKVDTRISVCWMLNYRLLQPVQTQSSNTDPLSSYLVDVQFAVGEEKASNDASHSAVWGTDSVICGTKYPLFSLLVVCC